VSQQNEVNHSKQLQFENSNKSLSKSIKIQRYTTITMAKQPGEHVI
jgi:hypothetical protein